MAKITRTFEVPEPWYGIIDHDFELDTALDDPQHNASVNQQFVEDGLMVNVLQYMLEKKMYVPTKYEDYQMINRCEFLKTFNFLEYRENFKRWISEPDPKETVLKVDRACTFESTRDLKEVLSTQFVNNPHKTISMEFTKEFDDFITFYCNRWRPDLGFAMVLFGQCGRSLDRSNGFYDEIIEHLYTIYEQRYCKKWPESPTSIGNMIGTYKTSFDKENVYLHTPDKGSVKCPFDKLDLYL